MAKGPPKLAPPKSILVQGLSGETVCIVPRATSRWHRRRRQVPAKIPSLPVTLTEPMLVAAAHAYRRAVRDELSSKAAVKRIYKAMRDAALKPTHG